MYKKNISINVLYIIKIHIFVTNITNITNIIF